MSQPYIIKGPLIVNEGMCFTGSVAVRKGVITDIYRDTSPPVPEGAFVIDGSGKVLMPGVIDTHVHFRDPGLTHKGDMASESRAAVAGGVTSVMDMPNTKPPAVSSVVLQEKFTMAAATCLANYSFYLGATNDNIEEIVSVDPEKICGIKVFMGASTGNMLVDDSASLERIFSEAQLPVAVHCEDEASIMNNLSAHQEKCGHNIPVTAHPHIRTEKGCYISSSKAVRLAKKHDTRLHVLHLSTARELSLFNKRVPLTEKRITAEACVHHLWFTDKDYRTYGSRIRWNPAVKTAADRKALRKAVCENRIDTVATDHAPHLIEEKNNMYTQSPSGGPLIQHALPAMLEMYHQGVFSLEKIVEKMSHHPAECFRIKNRGFIRKGYKADLVLADLDAPWQVKPENIRYKCGWSPFEDHTFYSKVTHTWVNGHLVFENDTVYDAIKGERLEFNR